MPQSRLKNTHKYVQYKGSKTHKKKKNKNKKTWEKKTKKTFSETLVWTPQNQKKQKNQKTLGKPKQKKKHSQRLLFGPPKIRKNGKTKKNKKTQFSDTLVSTLFSSRLPQNCLFLFSQVVFVVSFFDFGGSRQESLRMFFVCLFGFPKVFVF